MGNGDSSKTIKNDTAQSHDSASVSQDSVADYLEENTLGGRLKRYARVSGTVTGLAAKLAGQKYLGIDINKTVHAEDLKMALGNLKGPLMKMAQLLATIPEALPPEYARELQQLQSNAPAMGWPFVKRRMKTELGPDWQKHFANFPQTATAAASLGQVHKATLHDGRVVACKLQYPDMASAIEADLKQLKLFLGIFESYDRAVSTEEVQHEIADRLREELDYKREARAAGMYAHMLAPETGVHVPAVIEELSTDRLLTSTWVDGQKILNFKDAPLEVRNTIAMNLFRAWYVPLYYYGTIHGDPHFGNYSVRDDHSINLLDFGCVRLFPSSFVNGVLELYHALRTDDHERAVHAYETWGFKNMSKDMVTILNVWAGFLYGPVLDDRVRTIGVANGAVYGRETAQKVHAELRKAGGVTVPREFVFMDRAALGLGSVFIHLQAEINWYQIFNGLIADFDQQALTARQNALRAQFNV